MDRTILHCDCNSFFASVECVYRPELWDVPMAVCGDPKSRHGIVLAKNERAKAYGIVTAETVWQAKKKCPDLVLVPPHHDRYHEFCRRINEIYCEYTDRVEPFSIDESWLDVTGSRRLFGDGVTIADALRRRIREEIGVTISVGVSFNKLFAKMGSDYKKPDATTVITRDNYRDLLYPLPVGQFMFVGRSAAATLARMGITTIGDLAATDRAFLVSALGKLGGSLHDSANALDNDPVRLYTDKREVKSVGNGMTFHRDLSGEEEVRGGLLYVTEPVAARLREQGLYCRTVQLTVKFPSLKVVVRQRSTAHPTRLVAELLDNAWALLQDCWQPGTPVRSLTVTAGRLTREAEEQLCLFEEEAPQERERKENLEDAVDRLRRKYGKASVRRCAVMEFTEEKNKKSEN